MLLNNRLQEVSDKKQSSGHSVSKLRSTEEAFDPKTSENLL